MICKWCNIEKPLEDFYESHLGGVGIQSHCKECHKDYYKQRYNSHDKYLHAQQCHKNKLKRIYGITPEQLADLYKQQDGKCVICNTPILMPLTGTKQTVAYIDHNHSTGKVRGLLCLTCNTGLGQFNDDINRMNNAVKYLIRNK